MIVVYKDDAIMMTELHQWMKVWANFNSATEAVERFSRLKTLAKSVVDVTQQGEMLAAVREQVRMCMFETRNEAEPHPHLYLKCSDHCICFSRD